MSVTLNPHILPPGGFYFVDDEGIKFVGSDVKRLATAVREYRMLNSKPAGNPAQEINDFTCNRYPQGCRGAVRPIKAAGSHLPMVARVTRWLTIIIRGMSKQPGSYVTKMEASRRAAICLQCPHQSDWLNQCAGCAEGMRRLSFSARKGQEAEGGAQLKGCGVLGEDTRTSVFLDKMTPSERPELPVFCWRKKTS